jgi:outer membrane protein OmpA-like peptidoglycan-associated protein
MAGIDDTGKASKAALKKAAKVAGDGAEAAKNVASNAAEATGDAVEAGVDAAKGALGAVGGMLGGLASKTGKLAASATDAAKGAVEGAVDKAADLADGAMDAAKGAAGAVGEAVGNVAEGVGNVAGDAVDAVKGAAGAVGDAVGNVADSAVDATKDAIEGIGKVAGGAADLASDTANKIGGAGVAAVGAGAAVLSGAAAGLGNLGKGAMDGLTGGPSASSGGSDDGLPPMAARLDAAEKRNAGPSIFLPILGVVGLGALAYFGWQTISQGDGTLFPQRAEAPIAAPAPAVAAPSLPAWLTSISGNSVIANGEADSQEAKDNALKEITLAVKAAPEGATSDIIDNITVKGSTTTPVGAALAALGANPTAAACNTAFATTMAGRTINFSTGGASISGDNASLLNTLTAVANVCKAHKIEVAGHTDSVGIPENNQALSQKRADAVKAYWTGKGVAAEGLVAKGYGETKPVEPVADETPNEKNRRIDFNVTDAAAPAAEPAK